MISKLKDASNQILRYTKTGLLVKTVMVFYDSAAILYIIKKYPQAVSFKSSDDQYSIHKHLLKFIHWKSSRNLSMLRGYDFSFLKISHALLLIADAKYRFSVQLTTLFILKDPKYEVNGMLPPI